ncbi:MAG: hypothetical protein H0V02_02340 [Nocardioidaceae bacterium]|nr:hypothetical protein [Nocardioidaceae bacterium]
MNGKIGNVAELIAAVAAGRPLAQAATAANMSVRTAQRRLHDRDVVLAINEARVDMTRQAVGELTALRDLTLIRLREVLSGEYEVQHVLRAAELVLRNMAAADAMALSECVLDLQFDVVALHARMDVVPGSHDG